MKVFVVFHADLEDDRYVRFVCDSMTLAEELLTLDEVYRSGDRTVRRTHGPYCCGVDEEELLDHHPEIEHGPDSVYAHAPGPPLFGGFVSGALRRSFLAPNPLMDLVRDKVSVTLEEASR